MATPKDNTVVVQMLKDIKKDAYHWKQTPVSIRKKKLGLYQPSSSRSRYSVSEASSSSLSSAIATQLNFSFLEDTTRNLLEISNSAECSALKRQLQSFKGQLHVSEAKLKGQEGMISLMEPSHKKTCLGLENQLESCKRQNEVNEDKIKTLSSQLRRKSSEGIDARNLLIESEMQRKRESENKDHQITTLKIECSKLKSEVAEAQSEKAEFIRKLNTQIASLELELATVKHEVERSEEYIQLLEKKLEEQSNKSVIAIQLQKELNNSEMKIKSLECQLEEEKEASLIARAMQAELKLLPELRQENQQLKEEMSKYKDNNIMLFEEKIWNLQEKLNQYEKKVDLLTKFQAENEQLKEKITEWERLIDDKDKANFKSPSTFSRRLSEYQKNEVILTNKIVKLTSHCRNMNSMKNKLEAAVAGLSTENTKAKQLISSYENSVKLCQKKILLLTKEQESCRKLIDSFVSASSETSFCGSNISIQYVRTLEENLSVYKNLLEKAENDMKGMQEQLKDESKNPVPDTEDSATEIQKLREENAMLLLKVEEAQAEKLLLEERLSVENWPPKTTERSFKVVHMRHNPLDEAVQQRLQEHKQLREENDRLRKRIKVLEEEGAKAENVTLKVQAKLAEEGSSETIQGLTKKLNEAETKCELLTETFRKTSQQLREACYMLTGYKIEMVNSNFKLYHMYAESPDDCLIFQLSPEGTLSLLENEYTVNQKDRIDTYLLRYDSIPAFLASITMDLFSHQTCVIMDRG